MTIGSPLAGVDSNTYKVNGARQIDVHEMKLLLERGAIFIDVGYTDSWVEERIPGSINLTGDRSNNPSNTRLERKTLIAIAQKGDEVVLYCTRDTNCPTGAYEAAMIANWGYDKVYFFTGDAVQAWKDAGYPVETGPVQ
jgi:rhodanese-related sulfurtransferase